MNLQEIDSIIREYYPSYGSKVCSEKTGKNVSYIRTRAYNIGVKVNIDVRYKLVNANPKRLYNRNYNISIDKILDMSPESCYVLGFLWGDGCIHKSGYHYNISLSIVTNDYLDIENTFNYLGSWTKYIRNRENRQQQTTICTNNKRIYNFLFDNNYKEKSTGSSSKILSLIPENLKYLWWRGYSDADGCFQRSGKWNNQFDFAGHHDTDWNELFNLFDRLNCKYHYYQRILEPRPNVYHSNSNIKITTGESLSTWIRYLYPTRQYDGFGLKRKFEKAMEIIDYYESKGLVHSSSITTVPLTVTSL